MSQRKCNFVPEEFYHLYNRGTDKRTIFCDTNDHVRFLHLLHLSNNTERINVRDISNIDSNLFTYEVKQRLVAIGAYCLMPNHYHLLVTPVVEDGVSIFMKKLLTAYSMYFNKKYERTGTLFEGKFKSQLAENDQYLKYLFSYIHLNPVKLLQNDWKLVGLKDLKATEAFLNEYKYSSYQEACGHVRSQSIILNKEPFPVYWNSIAAAEREINDWLNSV